MPPVFWTQRVHFGPAPRMEHAMVYDASRQRVVLFGGAGTQESLGDTWVWDGAYWTQVADTGPNARHDHAMVYDVVRQQVVLFGGFHGVTRLEDTWVWDGASWTQVAERGPSRRAGHAMACDEARGLVVLFGGFGDDEDEVKLGDTWEWEGAAWIQREESGPAARFRHVMAYNAANARVVLFGGAAEDQVFNDTWEWNGTLWRQMSEFGAPGVLDAAMTQDGRGSMLFGGLGSPGQVRGSDSTWEWDGRFWTEIQHFGPPGRFAHAIVFDAARRRVVLFGGNRLSGTATDASLLGDTWECPAREPMLISLTVEPAEVRQFGTLLVTVRMSGMTGEDLPVQLVSSNSGQAVTIGLPSTVVVARGQAFGSATVVVSAGVTGDYTITASAGGVGRSTSLAVIHAAPPGTLSLVAALPNPEEDAANNEAIHLRNEGSTPVNLAGWLIANDLGLGWRLDARDGSIAAGQVAIVTRQNRSMTLANGGSEIELFNPVGQTVDQKTYGPAAVGQLVPFA